MRSGISIRKKGLLPAKQRIALEFARKAAHKPISVTDEDIKPLKDVGYADAEVVELIAAALLSYQLSAYNTILNLDQRECRQP